MAVARLSRHLPRLSAASRPRRAAGVARAWGGSVSSMQRRLCTHLIPASAGTPPPSDAGSDGLYDFMARQWESAEPSTIATICHASVPPRTLTYAQLPRRISAAAHVLRAEGFKQGDVLNIHLHNCEQFIVSYLAVAALGGTSTTSNPLYTAAELAGQQQDSGAKFVLSSRAYEATVNEAVALSGTTSVSFIEDSECFANASATEKPPPALERPIDGLRDVLTLPYSSGTTGKPKGVMLSHSNVVSNITQVMEHIRGHPTEVHKGDKVLCVLPLFHIYGMVLPFCKALCSQGTVVLLPKFEPVSFLEAIQDNRVTMGHFVPPILLFLAKHPLVKQYDVSSLRAVTSGAAPLDASTQQSLNDELGLPIHQGWGMTELAPVGALDNNPQAIPGSAGKLIPGTKGKVVDMETLKELPAGEVGEICISGPQRMLGYLNRPDATAETIMSDGFLRTGDVGYYDSAGNLFVVDRFKELIKVKGLQVAPAELEGRLLEHPEIVDAAVIGVPDTRCGQVPKAFIVRKEGSSLDGPRIQGALAATLAEYKVPAYFEFVEAIPKSASGKILRKNLS